MNTKSLSLIVLGSITVAIHLIGFAAVDVGAHKFLAQSVSYRDLDLSRPTDAAVLYERIGHAAAEVCEPFDGSKGHAASLQHKLRRPGHRDDGCAGQRPEPHRAASR